MKKIIIIIKNRAVFKREFRNQNQSTVWSLSTACKNYTLCDAENPVNQSKLKANSSVEAWEIVCDKSRLLLI